MQIAFFLSFPPSLCPLTLVRDVVCRQAGIFLGLQMIDQTCHPWLGLQEKKMAASCVGMRSVCMCARVRTLWPRCVLPCVAYVLHCGWTYQSSQFTMCSRTQTHTHTRFADPLYTWLLTFHICCFHSSLILHVHTSPFSLFNGFPGFLSFTGTAIYHGHGID